MKEVHVVDSFEHMLLKIVLEYVRVTTGESDDVTKQHVYYFYQFNDETFCSSLYIYNETKYCVRVTVSKVDASVKIHYGEKNPIITRMKTLETKTYAFDEHSPRVGTMINEYLLTGIVQGW